MADIFNQILAQSATVVAHEMGFDVVEQKAINKLVAMLRSQITQHAEATRLMMESSGRSVVTFPDVIAGMKHMKTDVKALMYYSSEIKTKKWMTRDESDLSKKLSTLNQILPTSPVKGNLHSNVYLTPDQKRAQDEAHKAQQDEAEKVRLEAERKKKKEEKKLKDKVKTIRAKKKNVFIPNFADMSFDELFSKPILMQKLEKDEVEPEKMMPPRENTKKLPHQVKPKELPCEQKPQKPCEPLQDKKIQAVPEMKQQQSQRQTSEHLSLFGFLSESEDDEESVSVEKRNMMQLPGKPNLQTKASEPLQDKKELSPAPQQQKSKSQTPEMASLFGFLSDSENEEENVAPSRNITEKAALPNPTASVVVEEVKTHLELPQETEQELVQPQKQQKSQGPIPEQASLFGFISDSENEKENVRNTKLSLPPKKEKEGELEEGELEEGELEEGELVEPEEMVPPQDKAKELKKQVEPEKLQVMPEQQHTQQLHTRKPTPEQDNLFGLLSDSDNEEEIVARSTHLPKKTALPIPKLPVLVTEKKNPMKLPQKPKLQKKVNEQPQDQQRPKNDMKVSRDHELPKNSMMESRDRKVQQKSLEPRQDKNGQKNLINQDQDQKLKPIPLMQLKLQPPQKNQHWLSQQIESKELPREPKLQESRCVSPLDQKPTDRKFTFLPRIPKKKFEQPQDQKLKPIPLMQLKLQPPHQKQNWLPQQIESRELPREPKPQKRACDEPLVQMHEKNRMEMMAQDQKQQKKVCEQLQDHKLEEICKPLQEKKVKKNSTKQYRNHMHKAPQRTPEREFFIGLLSDSEDDEEHVPPCREAALPIPTAPVLVVAEPPIDAGMESVLATAKSSSATEQLKPIEPTEQYVPKLKLKFKFSELNIPKPDVCSPTKPNLKVRIKNPLYQELSSSETRLNNTLEAEKAGQPVDGTTLFEKKEGDRDEELSRRKEVEEQMKRREERTETKREMMRQEEKEARRRLQKEKEEEERLRKEKNASIAESSACSSTAATSGNKNEEKIYYCPVCSVPYCEGSKMIGCDRCDKWYHWYCVGLTTEPTSDKWYCGKCTQKIQKRKEKKRALLDAEESAASAKRPKH